MEVSLDTENMIRLFDHFDAARPDATPEERGDYLLRITDIDYGLVSIKGYEPK